MFRRVRIELVAWSVATLALILVAIGLSAYFFLRSSLDNEIDTSIRQTYQQITAPPPGAGGPNPVPDDRRFDGANPRNIPFQSVPTDVFVVVTDEHGDVILNPREANLGSLNFENLAEHASSSGSWSDVSNGSESFRIASYPLDSDDVLHIGRSLAARNEQLARLTEVMIIGGIAGIVFATLGGLWLAGRALVPIRRSFESQRRFVSDASHELRTPIAVVRANNELLLRHPEDTIEENRDQVEAIAAESEHLTRLIEELMMLARADEGRLALSETTFDLGELASEVARDLTPMAASKGVELTASTALASVEGDRPRIRQVLVILLDNALKYTPRGGKVGISVTRNGHRAEATVSDTGPGIAADQQARIFDRFYQTDTARTHSSNGTGLGLAIARTIVDLHHGTLTVASSPGDGAAFTMRLRAKN